MRMLRFLMKGSFKAAQIIARLTNKVWRGSYKLTAFAEGFWLSVLPKSVLLKSIEYHYRISKKYVSDVQIKTGLFEWEKVLVDRFVNKPSVITIIGAGNGREAVALHQMGFNVSAFDPNEGFVKQGLDYCSRNHVSFRFEVCGANTIPTDARCDVFWIGWGAYTHMVEQSKRISFLKNIRTVLNDGGLVILSFWTEKRHDDYLKTMYGTSKILRLRSVGQGESIFGCFWGMFFTRTQILEDAQMSGYELLYYQSEPYGHAVLRVVGSFAGVVDKYVG